MEGMGCGSVKVHRGWWSTSVNEERHRIPGTDIFVSRDPDLGFTEICLDNGKDEIFEWIDSEDIDALIFFLQCAQKGIDPHSLQSITRPT
jgi:hypothetical protein